MMKIKVFHIVQQLVNSKTNEKLIDEEQIIDALNHRSIKKWAYILHDKDAYLENDYQNYKEKNGNEPNWKVGDLKPKHYHIVGFIPNSEKLEVVAKWFKVPINQVDVPKGKNVETAFIQNVQYLTHESNKEQEKGKHKYLDNNIKSNFNFREEINKLERLGVILNDKDLMLYQVLNEGKTLRECREENIALYTKLWDKLEKNRKEYLLTNQKPPKTRINFYICGEGGTGKGLMSRALARQLFPNIENEEDIYFEVGGNEKITFDGYDGQPVIIWNDVRAIDLIRTLGNRGNVFDAFDTHPSPVARRQNIKYGSVKLCNTINIVNSVEDYTTFLNGLAGEYITRDGQNIKAEDKKQSYRRFPIILALRKDNFDLLINKGFMDNNDDFFTYEVYSSIEGDMQQIAIACAGREELERKITAKLLTLPLEKYNTIKNNQLMKLSEEEIMKKFKDFGKRYKDNPFNEFTPWPETRKLIYEKDDND